MFVFTARLLYRELPCKLANEAHLLRVSKRGLPGPTTRQSFALTTLSLLSLRLQQPIPLRHFPVSVVWPPTFSSRCLATSTQIPVPFRFPALHLGPRARPPHTGTDIYNPGTLTTKLQ